MKQYTKKDIGKICPKSLCRGKLQFIENVDKNYKRYVCLKCGRTMLLDKQGCGTYE
jgi:hypothetical protein